MFSSIFGAFVSSIVFALVGAISTVRVRFPGSGPIQQSQDSPYARVAQQGNKARREVRTFGVPDNANGPASNKIPPEMFFRPGTVPERYSNKSRKYQAAYKAGLPALTDVQKDVAFGLILGDAHVNPRVGNEARIEFLQSSQQKALVDYLFYLFKDFTFQVPQYKDVRVGKAETKSKDRAYGFNTCTHPFFSELHRKFYVAEGVTPAGNTAHVRHIPENAEEWLNARVLAFHLMTDGNRRQDGNTVLATHGFPREESVRYKDAINNLFGLEAGIQRSGGYHYIYFPVRDGKKLQTLLEPYMLPLFRYKIGLGIIPEPDNA